MDRITKSLLDEFSREHDLGTLPEERQFEHFASYLTAGLFLSEAFDTCVIVTGSGGDTGIDGISIIVNVVRRHPADEKALQRAMQQAVRRAALLNWPRRIRCDIRSPPTSCNPATTPGTVQELLGHKDVSTTMIYTHVLNRGERGVRSPLDGVGV